MNKKNNWLSAIVLGVFIHQNAIACDSHCPAHAEKEAREHYMHHHHHFEKMIKKLDLTTEQTKKIDAIIAQTKASMHPKVMALHQITAQLYDLSKANVINESKMNELISQKEALVGEITKIRVMERYQIHLILNEQQKAKIDKATDEMKKHDHKKD